MKSQSQSFGCVEIFIALLALVVLLPGTGLAQTAEQNALNLNIGFNGADYSGSDAQPPKIADFYNATESFYSSLGRSMPGVRRCHAYVSWDVAEESGTTVSEVGSKAWLEAWLQGYSGYCDQALITFKWIEGVSCQYHSCDLGTGDQPPHPAEVGAALQAFLNTSWPGWSGTFAFTPWNEPNNPGTSGDGFPTTGTWKVPIGARTASDYYLAMRYYCTPANNCEIAAGDFASNGSHWEDFIQHCPDDTSTLCSGGSYLDTFKYYLNHDATAYGLPSGFRPEFVAYHAWADANDYLHYIQTGQATNCYTVNSADCVTRLLYDGFSTAIYSGNSSWTHVHFWDTEVGVGQVGNSYTTDPTNDQQAQTAAFMLNLTGTVSSRFWRLFYTRIWDPNGDWWSMFCSDGSTTRQSFTVWANRETSYTPTGSACPGS